MPEPHRSDAIIAPAMPATALPNTPGSEIGAGAKMPTEVVPSAADEAPRSQRRKTWAPLVDAVTPRSPGAAQLALLLSVHPPMSTRLAGSSRGSRVRRREGIHPDYGSLGDDWAH